MCSCTVLLLVVNISLLSAQSLPLLLLVSFDGFRHDYPRIHGPLKNFQRLAERGVHARNMISAFTTATFPNHYSSVFLFPRIFSIHACSSLV